MIRILVVLVAATVSLTAAGWGFTRLLSLRECLNAADDRSDKPRVFLQTTQVDLGTVSAHTPLVARVPIRNDGRPRLIVRREGGGCCGLAEADDAMILSPGDSSVLQVTINASGRRGRIHQSTSYTTNDPALPRFVLTVSANIVDSTE